MKKHLIVFIIFISCNQGFNYNQFEPIKDMSLIKGKWYGEKFWFKSLEKNKYEFIDNSYIQIKDDFIIQNGKEMGKFKFELKSSSIVMQKDTIPKVFKIQINDKKNKILLSYTKDRMEMIRLYYKY